MVRKEVLSLRQQLSDRDETISELKWNSDTTIKMLKEKVQHLKNQLPPTQLVEKEPAVTISKDYPPAFQSIEQGMHCLLYTSPSPRDATLSRMPSSA